MSILFRSSTCVRGTHCRDLPCTETKSTARQLQTVCLFCSYSPASAMPPSGLTSSSSRSIFGDASCKSLKFPVRFCSAEVEYLNGGLDVTRLQHLLATSDAPHLSHKRNDRSQILEAAQWNSECNRVELHVSLISYEEENSMLRMTSAVKRFEIEIYVSRQQFLRRGKRQRQ